MRGVLIPLALVGLVPVAAAHADCPVINSTSNTLKMSKPADGYDQYGDAKTFVMVAPGASASIPEGQEWAFLMLGNYTGRTCSGGTTYTVTWDGMMKISP